jgi:hypothetical protein
VGPVVGDMFCLMQLDLELAIRAKGMLMAREAGLEVPVNDALRAQLAERTYLEKTIGATATSGISTCSSRGADAGAGGGGRSPLSTPPGRRIRPLGEARVSKRNLLALSRWPLPISRV